jgi:hypothetical protein
MFYPIVNHPLSSLGRALSLMNLEAIGSNPIVGANNEKEKTMTKYYKQKIVTVEAFQLRNEMILKTDKGSSTGLPSDWLVTEGETQYFLKDIEFRARFEKEDALNISKNTSYDGLTESIPRTINWLLSI